MTEPLTFKITSPGNFLGFVPMSLIRDNFTIQGGRFYAASLLAPAGIVPADFFGFFAPESTKLVGVAFTSLNPTSLVAVMDSAGRLREQVNLTTAFQYVVLHANDRLAIATTDATVLGGATEIMLVVNEMSEAEHVEWALAHPPMPHHTRLRIIRPSGAAFVPNPTGASWEPPFVWDPSTNILEATDDLGNGPIPIPKLCPYPKHFGCFVSIRYANKLPTTGRLYIVDKVTRDFWRTGLIPNVRWSRVQYVSHDDHIALEATVAPAGGKLVCDIEVVRVEPQDRQRGRYANGL